MCSFESLGGRGDAGRRHLQRVGAGDKVVFVGGEESEDRSERRPLAERRAQFVGREPGEPQQPLGARFVAQNPAERVKRQRGIILKQARVLRRDTIVSYGRFA